MPMSTSVQYRGSAAAAAAAAASHRDDGGGVGVGVGVIAASSSSSSAASTTYASGGGVASSSIPLRRPPPAADRSSAARARRVARRKNSKPFGSSSSSALSVHPDEVFHLALLGFSLFAVGAVAIYRATAARGEDVGYRYRGDAGDPAAADDASSSSWGGGSGSTLRAPTDPAVPNSRWSGSSKSGGGGSASGGRVWLGGWFGFGSKRLPGPRPCAESLDRVGDKSRPYYELRQEYEALLPEDADRTRAFVRDLRRRDYAPLVGPEGAGYDVRNCPPYPPPGYPVAWPVLDVLENWPSDDPEPRPRIYQGLCVFDHGTELEKARNYRAAEVPFVVRDDPSFLRTAERWNQPGYVERMLGDVKHRTEYSPNNHFMYWMSPRQQQQQQENKGGGGGGGGGPKRGGGGRKKKKKNRIPIKEPEGWSPPTKLIRMAYREWFDHANATDDKLGPDNPHWYYRLIGCGEMGKCDRDSSEYLFDEIPNFQPRPGNFYIVEPERQRGIHCRFGIKGVVAENHFDGSRNTIALLGGERRYILSHPDQCPRMALLPKGHPSARHSAVDWSNPDLDKFPQFEQARVNEVVMQPGDALYLPTNWFHYIVSLELNFQCNSRSGINADYMEPIRDCGF